MSAAMGGASGPGDAPRGARVRAEPRRRVRPGEVLAGRNSSSPPRAQNSAPDRLPLDRLRRRPGDIPPGRRDRRRDRENDDGTAGAARGRSGRLEPGGQTSLPDLCAALKACRHAASRNDTGPMHVAAAVGTPVVVHLGSTSPALTGPGLPGDPRHAFFCPSRPPAPLASAANAP